MKPNTILICCNEKDENYLEIGIVTNTCFNYVDNEYVELHYKNGNKVKYPVWKMEGCFQKITTECI